MSVWALEYEDAAEGICVADYDVVTVVAVYE